MAHKRRWFVDQIIRLGRHIGQIGLGGGGDGAGLRAVAADAALAALIEQYLQRRSEAGEFDETSPTFVDEAGRPLSAAMLFQYLRRLRSITVNMEFNGALCRGRIKARTGFE